MTDNDYIYAPPTVEVAFSLEPAMNAVDSLHGLYGVDQYSGFSDWVYETARRLTDEERRWNTLIFTPLKALFFDVATPEGYASFPEFIDGLAARDPQVLIHELLSTYIAWYSDHLPEGVTQADLIADADLFVNSALEKYPDEPREPLEALWREAHTMFHNPAEALQGITAHLRQMWDKYLRAEWAHVLPMLTESVEAFSQMNYSGLSSFEAVRAVIGRDLRDAFGEKLSNSDKLVFVPSAHIGPYVSAKHNTDRVMYLVFGARLPREFRGHTRSTDLSRAELITRLNALADNHRLRILEMLMKHQELCAQDIIERLELSQSSVSRHLSQLRATGYVTERRKDVAKCYSLNPDRIQDTIRALENFLMRR